MRTQIPSQPEPLQLCAEQPRQLYRPECALLEQYQKGWNYVKKTVSNAWNGEKYLNGGN